ncbi:hypothetical protein [Oceanobacillus neutriphilus]|uniref:Uncharacterized protein n=1 Tax=Oceanobacillus neutriphilus TaxID=531815 RepID=A0ABQ2NMS0_9BACI|nr:hypothetical protein [Oceanobacillus neutriphilus]GGP07328.1 hypothetical protein GCM10011346_02880 [Oceanobacillus neutriphilus]
MDIKRIYIFNTWLAVGGNTPWNIEGYIEKIQVHADNIYLDFDSGHELKIKTNDYMILKGES